jgi:histidinol dehydrogenase
MTPEEIKNERMRVLKGKEIEEIDKKVEKDMIELTILEAAENIEKYHRNKGMEGQKGRPKGH